jgi:hypothetical protein
MSQSLIGNLMILLSPSIITKLVTQKYNQSSTLLLLKKLLLYPILSRIIMNLMTSS